MPMLRLYNHIVIGSEIRNKDCHVSNMAHKKNSIQNFFFPTDRPQKIRECYMKRKYFFLPPYDIKNRCQINKNEIHVVYEYEVNNVESSMIGITPLLNLINQVYLRSSGYVLRYICNLLQFVECGLIVPAE